MMYFEYKGRKCVCPVIIEILDYFEQFGCDFGYLQLLQSIGQEKTDLK